MSDKKIDGVEACSNHGCVFGHPGGMGTNGQCHCLDIRPTDARIRATRNVLALRAALTAERERADRAEADAVEAWRQVHLFKAEAGGPDGFATWKDAAIDERLRRVKAEAERDELRERVARLVGAIERYFEAKQYAMSYASLPDARDDIAEAFEQAELLMSDALEGK